MLVLSRKAGERIKIGDDITVVVTRVAGNRVMLGVEAPRNMRIVRSELKPLSEADVVERSAATRQVAQRQTTMQPPRPITVSSPQLAPITVAPVTVAPITAAPNVVSSPPLTIELSSDSTTYLARRAR